MPRVDGAMGGAVRFIGLAEVLGGLGIILPAATRTSLYPGRAPASRRTPMFRGPA